jgi:hypothetical protein
VVNTAAKGALAGVKIFLDYLSFSSKASAFNLLAFCRAA